MPDTQSAAALNTTPLERRALSRETCELVGRSPALRRVTEMLGKVAMTDSTVLILGESGTGKEVVAQCLHRHSARADGPFVAINCGAIPEELMESELFGHEKGAFTGALVQRKGRFEMAEGGTLFLDEIAEMRPAMQVKLLRVLQERQYERVGSVRSQTADVRIVAATHRNLEQRMLDGLFREDLFYRLNVFPVDLPPLRERGDDVLELLEYFLHRRVAEGQPVFSLAPEAQAALCRHDWPGNVRELQNLTERLAILHGNDRVGLEDLPARIRGDFVGAANPQAERDSLAAVWSAPPASQVAEPVAAPESLLPDGDFNLKDYLESLERRFLTEALDCSDQVVARAAERLGLRRTTMVEKLRKYGIQVNRD